MNNNEPLLAEAAERAERSLALEYSIAIVSTAVATGLRLALHPALGERLPLATYFLAVLVTGWYGGLKPALLAIVLGAVAADYFFIPPAGLFAFTNAPAVIELAIYVFAGAISALLSESLHNARLRSEQGALHISQYTQRLEAEIKQRQQTEDALRRKERELTDFVENAAMSLHWVAADGRILWANQAELDLLGYTRDEYIGRPIADFHADADVIGDILQQLQCNETLVNYPARLRCKDGAIRHVLITSNVLWEDGRFIHTRCFTRDITEMVEAEMALRQSEARYRYLIENANDIIYTLDVNGNLTSINKMGEVVTGYTREELLNQPIMRFILPEYREPMQQRLAQKLDGAERTRYELEIIAKDGQRRTLEINSQLMVENGQPIGIQGIARDVTERKQAEERLHASQQQLSAIFDNALDAILVTDDEARYVDANQAACELLGVLRDRLIGMRVADFSDPTLTPAEFERVWAAFLAEGEQREREHTLYRPDGTVRIVEYSAKAHFLPHRHVSFLRDITERKRAEERTAALQRLSAAFSEAVTVEQVAEVVISQGMRVLEAHNGLIAIVDEANAQLRLISAYRVDEDYQERYRTLPLDGPFLMQDTVRSGQPRWLETPEALAERYPSSFESMYRDGAQAVASLPLVVEGKTIGGMNVTFATPRTFSLEDRAFMLAVAQQCAQALERARLYDAEREQRTLAEALRDITVAINTTLNLDDVLDQILNNVNRVVPHDASEILLIEEGIARPRSSRGFNPARREALEQLELDISKTASLQEIIETRKPLLIPDVRVYPGWVRTSVEDDSDGYHAYIGTPIFLHEQIIGFLNLFSHTPGFFNPSHAERLLLLAEPVATAIQNARLFEQARELAVLEERQRLARELHDAVSQTLFSANVMAEALPRLWKRQPERAMEKLEELSQLTRGAAAEMRTLLLELRPSMILKASLGELFEQLCRAVQGRKKIDCKVNLDEKDPQGIPPDVHVALYRIAQESINNIIKHAQASQVTLDLRSTPERIELKIADNGRGFDPKKITSGFGLGTMRERAQAIGATLEVRSTVGRGTEVVITWTAPQEEAALP